MGSWKVLVVDDEPAWVQPTLEVLERAGYTARSAPSFPAALEALASFKPDLLITDIRLREYNGLHLLVRSRADHPRMASLVVSGFEDPLLAQDARREGAFDFLVKPFGAAVLLGKVADALASRNERRWPRLPVLHDLAARVSGHPARLLDVSYGGVRLALPFAASAGLSLDISIPTFGPTMNASAVWVRGETAGVRECGAALKIDHQTEQAWRQMVDSLQ